MAPVGGTAVNPVLAITQAASPSNRAVIEWSNFSIGRDAKVSITQPNTQSLLLNRVFSDAASGLPNLHVLEGGMNAWAAAGKPLQHGIKRLSLERQVRIVAGGLAATGGLLALVVNPLFAAMVLAKLPYNRVATCDVPAMIQALKTGSPPAPLGRASVGTAVTGCAR